MFSSFKKATLVLVALISVSSFAYAAEAGNTEKSVSGFFRRLFGYPVKAVQNTGEMTANTLNNTGEKVIAKTGENTSEVLTGHVDQTANIVGDAAVGTLQTTGQTVAETASIPVDSAKENAAQ